jgi:hypothetical protein
LLRAEGMQRRAVGIGSRIAGDDVQLRDRDIEPGIVGVMQLEELGVAFTEIEMDEPLVTSDAVLLMHHRRADLELGQVAQPVVDRGPSRRDMAAAPRRAVGVEFGLGDDRQVVEHEAVVQRSDAQRERRLARPEFFEASAGAGLQAVFGKQRGERLAPSGGLGEQQRAAGETVEEGLQAPQGIIGAAVDRQGGQVSCRPVAAGREVDAGVGTGGDEEGFLCKEQVGRRQQRPAAFAREHRVARLRFAPEVAHGFGNVVVQAEQRTGRQIVEQGGGLLEEQREPVLDAGAGDTIRHVAVDRRAGGIAFEDFAEALPEAAACGAVERKLACRQQADLRDGIQSALAVDVEGLDVLDLVVEKIEAEGQRANPSGKGRPGRRGSSTHRVPPPASRGRSRQRSSGRGTARRRSARPA